MSNLITIPGMDADSLTKMDVTPSGGGLRPFPCDASGWTPQTGVVLKAAYKRLGEKDNISIQVGNGPYGAEILISLDVNDVPPGTQDVAKAIQRNLETLTKAIKVLECHTNGKLDLDKLAKAHGMCVAFACKHKGFREYNGSHYHKISTLFNGGVPDLQPVIDVPMPPLPGQAQPRPAAGGEADPFDIPF